MFFNHPPSCIADRPIICYFGSSSLRFELLQRLSGLDRYEGTMRGGHVRHESLIPFLGAQVGGLAQQEGGRLGQGKVVVLFGGSHDRAQGGGVT